MHKNRNRILLVAALLYALVAGQAAAQGAKTPEPEPETAAAPNGQMSETMRGAELFYEVLLGEISIADGQTGDGYALLLDAAVKSGDERLYQRAVDVAMRVRAGGDALRAARQWQQAFPESREANRHVLRILLALNNLEESVEPLRFELEHATTEEKIHIIKALAPMYGEAPDKKQASAIVWQVLQGELNNSKTGATAWSVIGRLRLMEGDTAGALSAVRRAQAMDSGNETAVLLALALMNENVGEAEPVVTAYLKGTGAQPEARLTYARVLVRLQRDADAVAQLEILLDGHPDHAEAWLLLGMLQLQAGEAAAAESALLRYLALVQSEVALREDEEEAPAPRVQAWMGLAQLAQVRGDFEAAAQWIDRADAAGQHFAAGLQRTSLLKAQGRVEEARKMADALQPDSLAQQRLKMLAQVEIMETLQDHAAASALLLRALEITPDDNDLRYTAAILAEKAGNHSLMEELMREIIRRDPAHHHAYNALGYSMADRGDRLPEAHALVEKAMELKPGDPFITDSMGWVEYRMGNVPQALKWLEQAWSIRQDVEIAAHLGEVLWVSGDRARARSIWQQASERDADNTLLQETMQRLLGAP